MDNESNRYYAGKFNLLSSTPQYNLNSETPNQMSNSLNNPNNHLSNIQSNQQLLSPNDYIQGQNPVFIEHMYHPMNNLNPSNFAQAFSPAYQKETINYQNITSAASPNISNSNYENKINQKQISMTPRAKLTHSTNNNHSLNNEFSLTNSNNTNFNNLGDNKPMLQNIVSTADLKCKLDLRNIALKAKNAEYNPKRFAAVIMRIKEPKTTALIFSSGKMVCTGAKSEDDSRKASRKYAKVIKSLGFKVEFKDFKVQNIVGSCDIKFQIHLNKLNGILAKVAPKESQNKSQKIKCHYEPEVFPGLIYHMVRPEIVLLIFVSGKIVLTGAKQKEEIFQAFNKIYPLLKKCRNENKDNKTNKLLHQQEVEEKKALTTTQTKDETKEEHA